VATEHSDEESRIKVQDETEKPEARVIVCTPHRNLQIDPRTGGAANLPPNFSSTACAWSKAGHQPHRRRHYMASDDPEFRKAATVLGLYLEPQAHVAVAVWMRNG
jgi:hypothetical protein